MKLQVCPGCGRAWEFTATKSICPRCMRKVVVVDGGDEGNSIPDNRDNVDIERGFSNLRNKLKGMNVADAISNFDKR